MNCQEFERQIILFTELTEEEKLKLEVHIQNCAPCKRLFESATTTQNLIASTAKVNPVLADPAQMTHAIMDRIKNSEHHWWSRFDFPSLNLELNYIKYGLATASLFLLVFFGAEQLRGPYKGQEVSAFTLQNNSRPVTVVRKDFLKELRKGKTIAKSLLTRNCVSPFNINKVNTPCLREKLALHKVK